MELVIPPRAAGRKGPLLGQPRGGRRLRNRASSPKQPYRNASPFSSPVALHLVPGVTMRGWLRMRNMDFTTINAGNLSQARLWSNFVM